MKLINQSFEILEQKDFTLKGINLTEWRII